MKKFKQITKIITQLGSYSLIVHKNGVPVLVEGNTENTIG